MKIHKFLFGLILYCNFHGLGFITFNGFGVHWKDITRNKMYYSERNNLIKFLTLGNYHITLINK